MTFRNANMIWSLPSHNSNLVSKIDVFQITLLLYKMYEVLRWRYKQSAMVTGMVK